MTWAKCVSRLALLFTLAPVFRGFIGMLVSGLCFPLCGVMVLRLNLIPLRYMLMHGVILGGAVSLAMGLPLTPVCVVINVVLILGMIALTKSGTLGFSGSSTGGMLFSMGLAGLLMSLKDVPAKDTLNIIWGSPFALQRSDLFILFGLCGFLVVYIVLNFKTILALFFNQDVARSLGVRVSLHRTFMVLVIALVVALAMKLLGAFMVDALLVLPVLTASCSLGRKNVSVAKLFVLSCVFGVIFSMVGYVLAVMLNWPPAATIAIVSSVCFVASHLIGKLLRG